MKANELRIGNLVSNDGCLNTIENLMSDGVCTLKTMQGNFIHAKYDLIKPIPLTEEWLVKFGFEKDGDDLVLDTDLFLLVSYNDDDFVHLKSNNLETIISIKYVHQLQNLYFALTGEELTIKQL